MIRIASLCLGLYWLAIFVGTHLPSSSLPQITWSDKVLHLGAFSGLSFLMAWALPTREGRRVQHLALAFIIVLAYACFDEFTQLFIPGRTCDRWDVVADAVGAVCGLSSYLAVRTLLTSQAWGRVLIAKLSR